MTMTWESAGFPPSEAAAWEREGFGPFDAALWAEVYDDPVEARAHRNAGYLSPWDIEPSAAAVDEHVVLHFEIELREDR